MSYFHLEALKRFLTVKETAFVLNVSVDTIYFHALRHTFATRAIERGVNVKTLSDILGHSQVQITMDLYCHTSIDHMRDVMNSMSDLF